MSEIPTKTTHRTTRRRMNARLVSTKGYAVKTPTPRASDASNTSRLSPRSAPPGDGDHREARGEGEAGGEEADDEPRRERHAEHGHRGGSSASMYFGRRVISVTKPNPPANREQ
jgi:hypothetical protein